MAEAVGGEGGGGGGEWGSRVGVGVVAVGGEAPALGEDEEGEWFVFGRRICGE